MSQVNTRQKTESEVEEVTTPIKSVNYEQSVEERFTDNAIHNILPARYLLKDDDGNVVEEPHELFERVATNVAQPEKEHHDQETFEKWADEFQHLMETQQWMPNSPTLMNAGAELQQLSACISGDTPIYTRDGLKPMAEIEEGDEVLTHTGEFKSVTAHWSNGIKDTLNVKRGTSRGSNYSVTATPDHEFLTGSGWEELQEIDNAVHPTASPDVTVPQSFDLTKYTSVMGKDKPVVSDGGVVKVQNSDDPRTGEYDKQYSEVVSSVENTETLGYIAGAYLAEGDVDGSDVRFTIGADEEEFEEKIVSSLTELFDVHVSVMESSHGKWKTINASSPFIADFFVTQFGTGSSKKSIPEWMFAADYSYQKAVLKGILDGDAHKSESGWKLTLANPTLAFESSILARNLGYDVNFTLDAENELSASPTSRVWISENGSRTYMNTITKKEGEEKEVYDMEVEDNHSFVAGDFVVHNCFVLEPDDDMDDIFKTAKDAALIFKSGGGVGYTISHLRPQGAIVSSTGGASSGPLSFLEVYDTTCGTVQQGGKRRGAQMAILRVDHPDIGRFACAKREEGRFDNFNISSALTDDFVEAVKNDEMYTLYSPQSDYEEPFEVVEQTANFYNPEYENNPQDWEDAQEDGVEGKLVKENIWRDYADTLRAYDFENDQTVDFERKWKDEIHLEEGEPMELPARFIFDMIIDGAWRNGEPGLFYYDETNNKHSFDVDEHPKYKINATNPCAEQPLCEFEACNLGHINLSLMMEEDAVPFPEADTDDVEEYIHNNVDMEQLRHVAATGTRFLDNVVTQSDFPLDEIEERVGNLRKVGLGVMGFAQMLFQMGIRYGSEESYDVAEQIMGYIDWVSVQESHRMAKERGTFDAWEDSKYANPTEYPEWFENHTYEDPEDWEDGFPMRNHNTTTVAPTGTTSMLGDTTGGIEPLFDVANFKNVSDDVQGDDMLVQFDDYFRQTLEANDIDADAIKEQAVEQMRNNEFEGVYGLDIPAEIAEIFVTTGDLSAEQHAMMQRVFQQHVDSGISKTVNLPNHAGRDDVFEAFMLALDNDERGNAIKGLTAYRDGSRDEQVMTTRVDNNLDETDEELHQTLEQLHESGELSNVAAKELGILDEEEEALCDECGTEMEDDGESCTICPNCWYSPCA